jgi:predicted ArsR family transcriptional regulator
MRKRKSYTPPETFERQPRIAQVLKRIGRKRGTTAAEAAKALGWQTASIRAVVSRLGERGIQIERRWEPGRVGVVYRRSQSGRRT